MEYIESHGIQTGNAENAQQTFEAIERLLGLSLIGTDLTNEAKGLLAARKDARDAQDWQTSDKLREQLHAMGVDTKDTQNGQVWSKRRVASEPVPA